MAMAKARIGRTMMKIIARTPPALKAIMEEKISIIGLLTNILILMVKSCCTLWTSVVSLVIKEEGLNLSISEKENSWTLLYRSCLRFVEKPAPASEPNFAPITPKNRERRAVRIKKADIKRM